MHYFKLAIFGKETATPHSILRFSWIFVISKDPKSKAVWQLVKQPVYWVSGDNDIWW